ncbi:adenylyl-sulfate kinase [Burkholderia sp. MSHR3999]|uniref:adenylyl-sulfate kinase n=1 Tax=Burkholderia sp. MSHR3999 TaxID=1542965 RepID=UPI0005AC4F1E|nr:adenylyl-sulfate kinase [Burkholderia sp. MSHR3999]KIP17281.1 adenylyl-sulfate kinase [Burkholderia sp. MSHR3999]
MNSNHPYRGEAASPVVWLTGLSGAGKSTIANGLRASLEAKGRKAIALDGDKLRAGICADLGFSVADRTENIRRIAHIAKLFKDEDYVTVVATISPLASQRALARSVIGAGFIEVFVSTPLEECIRRDPKGLYVLADCGVVQNFTGVSATYERPIHPDLILDTSGITVDSAVASILPLLDFAADQTRTVS